MCDPRDIRSDLEPDAPDELTELGERLLGERPVPGDGFIAALRRRLAREPREMDDEER